MQAHRKIAVAGATGRVGRHVADVLKAQGHEVVAMSRSSGVDVVTGEGLATALDGVECVIDAATGPSPEQQAATTFFTAAARNLQQAGERAGVRRIVVVSIIGCDRFRGGYGTAKVAHEHAMRAGPIPVGILRAAQFHEFVAQLVDWGRQGEVSFVPEMRTQLVAAGTVAQALAELALATDPDWARAAAAGSAVRIEGVRDPSDPDSAVYTSGALLPSPHATLAGPTFEEWLDATA